MIAIDEASSRKFGMHFIDKAAIISTFTDCLVAGASHIGTSIEWKIIVATIEKQKTIYRSKFFVAMLCYYWI